MLVGVAPLPLIPAIRNIDILHYKKAKLCKHLQQSVRILFIDKDESKVLGNLCHTYIRRFIFEQYVQCLVQFFMIHDS